MSLNDTPSANRIHIGFFGMRNAGKSSVVNAVTGQALSLVSDIKGTTTDPVSKAMELLPLGPVVIIDTPGFDDSGTLGEMRVKRTKETLAKTDIAVLVVDVTAGLTENDTELTELFEERKIPYIIAYNKCDLIENLPEAESNEIYISAVKNTNIYELKELISSLASKAVTQRSLISDLIGKDDTVILVTPIDESAPKGRMILPQVQMIRAILDSDGINIVAKETQLQKVLEAVKNPKMVITDSQAFETVAKIVPEEIPLTSFSIMYARYKGNLDSLVKGAVKLDNINDGDKILISEGCTHHRQCQDIGTVKMPSWIEEYTGKKPQFEFTSGNEFPDDLSKYSLVVHCGGCMLNEREMTSRVSRCENCGAPVTNYGMAIAKMKGILDRSLSPFKKDFDDIT